MAFNIRQDLCILIDAAYQEGLRTPHYANQLATVQSKGSILKAQKISILPHLELSVLQSILGLSTQPWTHSSEHTWTTMTHKKCWISFGLPHGVMVDQFTKNTDPQIHQAIQTHQ
eukprot:TRINITY_DN2940_c0_g2_i5.p1 TRINITY_DN2940_c0_g2~~TRINITY_DN2940_c0_g2_i5.p1  ORF type:complete len:115 (+),score=7.23 TRINITY_DN2940_c0_g2_i5:92-436(+)